MSDVLLVHTEISLSPEKREAMRPMFDDIQKRTGLQPVVFEKGITGEVQRDLSELVAAIKDQTAAMRELADSNRAVVDLVIAQQQADDQDGEPDVRTFLDGSPRDD